MGEVRIQASLTNAVDEGMAYRGQLDVDEVRTKTVDAMVDTGAVNSVLPPSLANTLGLRRKTHQLVEYADGRREKVDVTDGVLIEIQGRSVYEECLILGNEVLIGQTVLEKTDLHVDCRSRSLVPNPAHPHQGVVKVKSAGTASLASGAG